MTASSEQLRSLWSHGEKRTRYKVQGYPTLLVRTTTRFLNRCDISTPFTLLPEHKRFSKIPAFVYENQKLGVLQAVAVGTPVPGLEELIFVGPPVPKNSGEEKGMDIFHALDALKVTIADWHDTIVEQGLAQCPIPHK